MLMDLDRHQKMEINFPLQPPATVVNLGSAEATGSVGKVVPSSPESSSLRQSVTPSDSSGTIQTKQANEEALHQAVDELQRKVQISASNLHFSIDHETGRTVVKVTDVNTQEVIRQIPPDEILRLDKALDRMWGLLLHKEG